MDFGAWQSMLQPLFPQWNNNLKFPEPEFRDGVYYFKVSRVKPWRQIAIAADNSLDELAGSIIDAFDFDGDHLYEFWITEPDGTSLTIAHPRIQAADISTDEFAIGYLPLKEGHSLLFHYDYGADW